MLVRPADTLDASTKVASGHISRPFRLQFLEPSGGSRTRKRPRRRLPLLPRTWCDSLVVGRGFVQLDVALEALHRTLHHRAKVQHAISRLERTGSTTRRSTMDSCEVHNDCCGGPDQVSLFQTDWNAEVARVGGKGWCTDWKSCCIAGGSIPKKEGRNRSSCVGRFSSSLLCKMPLWPWKW